MVNPLRAGATKSRVSGVIVVGKAAASVAVATPARAAVPPKLGRRSGYSTARVVMDDAVADVPSMLSSSRHVLQYDYHSAPPPVSASASASTHRAVHARGVSTVSGDDGGASKSIPAAAAAAGVFPSTAAVARAGAPAAAPPRASLAFAATPIGPGARHGRLARPAAAAAPPK